MWHLSYPVWVIYAIVSAALAVVYLVSTTIIQYWRLRKIPGPPLAAWTNLWLMWYMHRKEPLNLYKRRLHQDYGPVQRYGPNRVMFSDVSTIPIILGSTDVFPKASNHEPLKSYSNGTEVVSFLSLTDDRKAAKLKRRLHSTFSASGVLVYEQHIDHTVSELVYHLSKIGSTANLTQWLEWFAFDTMARTAFSEDQGFMSAQTDIGGAAAGGRRRFKHWNFFWTIPWLEALIYKNWFARRSKKPPSGVMRLAIRAVESRKHKPSGTHHDILDLYLRSGEADPETFTPSTIIGLTITTISAGSETIGYTTAICLHTLLSNPRVLAKLRAELEQVSPTTASGWTLPSAAALRALPYLEACVKESNRLRQTINIPSERVVPEGGRTIGGVFIPAGTIVAVNTSGMYIDETIWGPDVDVYRPERWLEASEEQRFKMNRANLLFSTGKRMCLGMNIAWLEMRKVIPALIMNFEMSLVHPDRDLYQSPGIFGEPGEVLVHLSPRRSA
ncbi:hypothetical protein NX059_011300 [Plenodomus lindquistii]|nr:hypothetical protein NX059_011300 [Plenodomus lindquistii]